VGVSLGDLGDVAGGGAAFGEVSLLSDEFTGAEGLADSTGAATFCASSGTLFLHPTDAQAIAISKQHSPLRPTRFA
jgi:hypothetical protein